MGRRRVRLNRVTAVNAFLRESEKHQRKTSTGNDQQNILGEKKVLRRVETRPTLLHAER